MSMMKLSENIKQSKNKFYEDKMAYKDQKAPPGRVFLDCNGNLI